MKRSLFLLYILWIITAGWAQHLTDSILVRLERQLQLFPQEKVCLHVDRTVFIPGDTICMKAYVTDAATLKPLIDDQFVYVELLDGQNRPLQRKRLIASTNLYTGYIPLSPDQHAGVYHLWAYTLYSSQVKGYDCLIPIQVGVPSQENGTENGKKADVPVLAGSSLFRGGAGGEVPMLRFFPEGGSIVEGTTCMVAFEATTAQGDSLDLEGDITDSQGQVLTHFRSYHHGLGFFPLTAEAGQQYSAVCYDRRGRRHSFPLPTARTDVACLRCRVTSSEVEVRINCGESLRRKPLFLMAHCRGQMVSLRPVQPGATYHLPLNQLPAGVNSLLLLDKECHVLSERLVFSNNSSKHLPLTITTDRDVYGLRDSIALHLSLPDMQTDELAFLSLTATDDAITLGRHATSLWSQLLLAYDLQGQHSALDEFFQPRYQPERLDLLMMICGWRRYDMQSVLQGRYDTPKIEKEREQSISGRVRQVFANKPVSGAEVVLAITKQGHLDTATSDSIGHFEFRGLNYPEDADVFIYALRQKNKRCIIETDRTYAPHAPAVSVTRRSAGMLTLTDIDSDLLEQYARDSHLLQEVVVKGKDKSGPYPLDNTTWSLDRKQIEEGEYPDLGFMLLCSNILNVDPASGRITADDMYKSDIDKLFKTDRRTRQAIKSTQPSSAVKLYVNGMHIPNLTYEDIALEDIDRVDLYMGSKAWVFGEDSVAGVVNITTRTGGINLPADDPFNNKVMRIVGYQKPIEYYFPRYQQGGSPLFRRGAGGEVPDMRRTVYWNPYLRLGKDTPAHLDFYSADLPTTYTVRVEGITSHGRIVDGQLKLNISE